MKPGYLTTEFWLSATAIALTQLGVLKVPDRYRWIVTVGVIDGYLISRGLAKLGRGSTPVVGSMLPPESVDPVAAEAADQKAHSARSES